MNNFFGTLKKYMLFIHNPVVAKKLLLFLISLCSSLISAWLAFFLTEIFFFDKLLYKKSALHGYTNSQWELTNNKYNFWIEKRIRDLRIFINQSYKQEIISKEQSTENIYTIALIGDSFAYGLGVRENESFGRVLEAKLNKIKPTKIYVLALPGDSIVENYAKFLLMDSNVRVDLYVFSMIENDLLYDHNHKYPNEVEVYNFLRGLCPQEEFIYLWDIEDSKNHLKNGISPSYSDKFANRCWVEKVVKEISLRTKRFFFFSTFSLNDLSLSLKSHLSFLDALKRELEFDYIDLVKNNGGTVVNQLDIPIKEWSVSKMESHPSKERHSSFATSLYYEITTNPRWGF